MFCKNCGKYIRGNSAYCKRCKSLLLFSRRKNLDKELSDEYESLILGCIVWAALIVMFNIFQWSNIEFLTDVQDLIVGNI